jgi:hypothetical protein
MNGVEDVMTIEELTAKVKALETRIRLQEDIEEIKKVQRMYGYYVDNHMLEDAIELFADDAESVEISDHGVFKGKSGITRFFKEILGKGGEPLPPWALYLVLQHQGVVNVDPNGKTARARWHGWMAGVTMQSGLPRQFWGHGIYENKYTKEKGGWKISKLYFNLTFRTPYEDGWLKTPVVGQLANGPVSADEPPTAYKPYPSGYKVPCHWKRPATSNS